MRVTAVLLLLVACLIGWAEAGTYGFTPRRNIPNMDINCNNKDVNGNPVTFCKVCGGVRAVADACDANSQCRGFDMDGSYCGYLKTAATEKVQAYREGFSSFCKMGRMASCPADFYVDTRTDIPGNDVNCGYKNFKGEAESFCRVSGTIIDAAAACLANTECKAFTMTGSYSYLKSAGGPTKYMEDAIAFVKPATRFAMDAAAYDPRGKPGAAARGP